MKTLKQQFERLDLSIRKTDSVTDLLKKQSAVSKLIKNNLEEFRADKEQYDSYIEKTKYLLDYCILKLAEATKNGQKVFDNVDIDLMKNRVWSRIEEGFSTEDELIETQYFMNV